ncbi:hypothetical protein U1Q18_038928 [Sarracenia purpurea var. burkii]
MVLVGGHFRLRVCASTLDSGFGAMDPLCVFLPLQLFVTSYSVTDGLPRSLGEGNEISFGGPVGGPWGRALDWGGGYGFVGDHWVAVVSGCCGVWVAPGLSGWDWFAEVAWVGMGWGCGGLVVGDACWDVLLVFWLLGGSS